MNKYNKENKYEGFSLVEMLITTFIIGFIMLIAALVLTTLIKVSTVTTNKTKVRNESEYVLELLRRTIRVTDPTEVKIYNSNRTYNSSSGLVSGEGNLIAVSEGNKGNEIHIRPYGSSKWICLAFYKDGEQKKEGDGSTSMGYILKTSVSEEVMSRGSNSCFNEEDNRSYNYIVLNSRFVNIRDFKISYRSTEDGNKEIQFDLEAAATYWYFATGAPLNRNIYRQAIVKTEGIMW